MGLNSWGGSRVTKKDVPLAKNYLTQDELQGLNRIVTMYLDYAELQAERRQSTTMAEWANKLDAFLQFNEHDVLQDTGRVSHDVAKRLAEEQYEKFTEQRRLDGAKEVSDFDAFLAKSKQIPKSR